MKKIYIKPTVIVIDDVLESSILQASPDKIEDDGNMEVGDGEVDPDELESKGTEFDPWDWSFRDDLLW